MAKEMHPKVTGLWVVTEMCFEIQKHIRDRMEGKESRSLILWYVNHFSIKLFKKKEIKSPGRMA